MNNNLNKKIKNIIIGKIPNINLKTLAKYEGLDFVTILVDGYAFRFPKNKESVIKIKLEEKLLKYLRNKTNLPIPVYEEGKTNSNFVYYKSIIGKELTPLFYKNLSKDKKERLDKELAKFIREIHSVVIPKNISFNISSDNWPKIYKKIEKNIADYFEPDEYFKIFLNRFKKFTAEKRDKCFVHGDLSGDNMIIDQNKQKIAGIIDFGDAHFSDPIVDFAHLWEFGGEMVSRVICFYTKDKEKRQKILENSNLYYCYIMLLMMVIKKKKT